MNNTLFGNKIISTISYNQDEIIQDILDLHCDYPIQLDPTFSVGNFYKQIPTPPYKFDINPQVKGVKKASANKLPIDPETINTIMFDPPFLAGLYNKKGLMQERFSAFKTVKELYDFYNSSIVEFYRILKKNGILIFKCQDSVNSNKQFFFHVDIIKEAEKTGFYTKDLFILLSKNRMISANHYKQQHARKFHSYFIVFQKK